MGKTLKEKLLDIKKEQEIGYVNFYNTGKIDTDTNGYGKRIKTFKSSEYEDLIKEVLYKAAESYAYSVTYDSIELFLSVGLVFNKSDVNDDNTIKENALPYRNNKTVSETINFTYLNAGYVGNVTSSYSNGTVKCNGVIKEISKELTMTLFTINKSSIEVDRYSKDAILSHNIINRMPKKK